MEKDLKTCASCGVDMEERERQEISVGLANSKTVFLHKGKACKNRYFGAKGNGVMGKGGKR